ncbi:MAG: hypothetical protein LQ340_007173 [Diploschistes diacapsis]|nr:MAG: hypothetical protein LQ340_007173 [Diploschistes diacapsis]
MSVIAFAVNFLPQPATFDAFHASSHINATPTVPAKKLAPREHSGDDEEEADYLRKRFAGTEPAYASALPEFLVPRGDYQDKDRGGAGFEDAEEGTHDGEGGEGGADGM